LFLQGLATTEPTRDIVVGLALGAGAGAVIGTLLYFGLVRIPVRHFFRVTGWLIVALAAGLAAQSARFLEQANVLPALASAVWDTSSLLTESSLPGQLLHVLVGYTARPSGLQLVFYAVTLVTLIVAARRLHGASVSGPRMSRAA